MPMGLHIKFLYKYIRTYINSELSSSQDWSRITAIEGYNATHVYRESVCVKDKWRN